MSGHKLLQYQHENREKSTDFSSCFPAASSRIQGPDLAFLVASISRALPSFQKKKQTAVETAEASSIVHGQDLHDGSRSTTTSRLARSRIPMIAQYLCNRALLLSKHRGNNNCSQCYKIFKPLAIHTSAESIQSDYIRGEKARAANLLCKT
ncbi:hypothetical protein Nepgr_023156 [Nepenthes gracilis]|uniref:Uncharacterized protein n=1 Tax=Nepenthes gracilis TaxID=150966 RepID=A0AAD3XYS2_NEPGR|nr:hypothetical protein Nepgr_023156 [Nepenthes gracilis]